MGSPNVRQLEFLSRVFGELIAEHRPASIAVLGCATGNGFEHVRPETVRRLVGIDINQEYLDICRARYAALIPGMELFCADFASCELEARSFDFIQAALFLEYVDPALAVEKCSRWLKADGVLAVVLQLPSEACGKVSETVYTSVRCLEPAINLIEPEKLRKLAARNGFSEIRAAFETLESGKRFFIGVYRLTAPRA